MQDLIRTEAGSDGVLLATIDIPGRTMNVFSSELMDALEALMDEVDGRADVRSVVVTSGKPSFLAGADLVMVRGFTERAATATHDEMFALCGRLGRLFVRLEASAKPYVAAVNGTALGGGLELALACRERLVTDDSRAQLGVPEVRWGLLPGAGGTQRLPRLVGFETAMPLLLSGRSIDPKAAVAMGLFAAAVPAEDLIERARKLAVQLQGEPYDAARKFPHLHQADVPQHSDETAGRTARDHGVSDDDYTRYPAFSAIVDSVLLGARLPLDEASDVEMRQFLRLMFSPVAGNMIRSLFLNRLRADREWAPPEDVRIERVTLGPQSAATQGFADALAKSKLPHALDTGLPADTIELLDGRGTRHRIAVCDLVDAAHADAPPTPMAVLSPKSPYGRVMEIIGANEEAADALARLAVRLHALPYRSRGNDSVLVHLKAAAVGTESTEESLDRLALAAQAMAAQNRIADTELFDVVACVADIAPAFSGGPFTHLAQHRDRLLQHPAAA
jgi:3-hydroxyacyl-CoA dehydrogenase/enoyl-CoA hydratase/3-hydroxybutyryl-CoA epimerase